MSDQIRSLQKQLNALDWNDRERDLTAQWASALETLEQKNNALMAQVEEKNDYDKIKAELDLFKSDYEGDSEEHLSLEQSLVKRNKRCEAELVNLRLEIGHLAKSAEDAERKISRQAQKIVELEKMQSIYEKMAQSPQTSSINQSDASISQLEAMPSPDDLVVILSNQRDRYQKKNKDLELVLKKVSYLKALILG